MLPQVPGDPPRNLAATPDRLRIKVPLEKEGMRLDHLLMGSLFWRSRASIQRLISKGSVMLGDGRKPRPATRVRADEILTILLPPRPPIKAPAYPLKDIPIIYEDEFLMAVNKPAGLPVHPAGRHLDGTLVGLLHERYRQVDESRDVVPRLCHRLDRETSGVVLVTKDEASRHLLGRQFEERTIKKVYLAVVEGQPEPPKGILDWPLAPNPKSTVRMKMEARTDGRGQAALTRYQVREHHGPFSLVEVHPATGRQHQIRVHLAALGNPVVGDKIYGPDESYFLDYLKDELTPAAQERLVLPRHALHAWKLKFWHPRRDEEMEVEAPIPEDMAKLLGR